MLSHQSQPTSGTVEPKGGGRTEQQILSQWIKAQPAHNEVAAAFGKAGESFSPDQIDAILAIRRKIAAA